MPLWEVKERKERNLRRGFCIPPAGKEEVIQLLAKFTIYSSLWATTQQDGCESLRKKGGILEERGRVGLAQNRLHWGSNTSVQREEGIQPHDKVINSYALCTNF